MDSEGNDARANFLPPGIRDNERQQQIDAIKVEVRKKYKPRIRAAASREEKRGLQTDRDAEIADRIEALLRERILDAPDCL